MDSFGSNIQDLFAQEELLHFVDPPDPSQCELTDSPDCLVDLELLSNSTVSWEEIFRQVETHLSPAVVEINDETPQQFQDDLTLAFEDITDEPSVGSSSIPPETEPVLGVQQHQPVKDESDSGVFDDLFKSMFGESEAADGKSQSDNLLESLMDTDFDPDYFDKIDIDSLDPGWPHQVEEADQSCVVMREHDYTPLTEAPVLPPTPPHSPEKQGQERTVTVSLPLPVVTGSEAGSDWEAEQQDLQFVISLPVRKEIVGRSQSILKKSQVSSETQPQGKPARKSFVRNVEKKYVGSIVTAKPHKKKNSRKKLEEEKELHNHKERQRRIDLNEAFGYLREIIPAVASQEKVSKLAILTAAKVYCEGLEGKLGRLETIHQEELVRQRQLGEILTSLQLQA